SKTSGRALPAPKNGIPAGQKIVKIYPYHDSLGREVYQVVRYEPKTFRQRHPDGRGGWKWSMDGVTRVLYRLPHIQSAEEVWVVEGEKDAETLVGLGFEATCNVGGAGKWLTPYTTTLQGKHVVLCGDNDKAGEEHVNKVMESLAGKVKTLRRVRVPADFKDVTDYVASFGNNLTAFEDLATLRDQARLLVNGVDLPLKTVAEMEAAYAGFVARSKESPLDLGCWLPSFRKSVRNLVPGDLVTVLAGTGVGKTAILQNVCAAFPLVPTVFFQMELSEEAMFERLVSHASRWAPKTIEQGYSMGSQLGPEIINKWYSKLLVCTRSGLTIEQIADFVQKAELKTGEKPRLVLMDYVQLIHGRGDSRYERFSEIAEAARQMANRLGVTVIMTSQIRRKNEDASPEVTKADAKESGSIENSSSLLLGAWREERENGAPRFLLRVLKNSRGPIGLTIEAAWSESLHIRELATGTPVEE
ncbi:MAG: DnaB-like helicase C-terminal domain-containing protein, partial [Verrucomicrobiota bacterium]